ncbi:hypothetical protein AABB24_032770 [Solanum stoloniferum]|uniref:Uncharacterized protein n=1 Tax=Solanum stoloniferum TaxID=62892 RepID=A0ABD2RKZ3_9SOLN
MILRSLWKVPRESWLSRTRTYLILGLCLYFEHRILAHIVATTLISRKGSLSSISTRDVFVLYCLLKRNTTSTGQFGSNNTCWKVLKTLMPLQICHMGYSSHASW